MYRPIPSLPEADEALWDQILAEADAYEEDDSSVFHVLREGRFDPSKPLVVLVHPGDACESDHPSPALQARAWGYQVKMGQEMMAERFSDCDVIVLHRFSSKFAFQNSYNVDEDYLQAIENFHKNPNACVLFGDDLEQAAAWIIEQAHTKERPLVFLSGAWSHKDFGCVTFVGKTLQADGATIEVSAASPSNPGNLTDAWRGKTPRKKVAP